MNYVHKLKFADQTAWEQFKSAGCPDCVMTVVEIGVLSTPGTYDDEGNEVTPPVPQPGYHVDILSNKKIGTAVPYCVATSHPVHGYGWAEPTYTIVTP